MGLHIECKTHEFYVQSVGSAIVIYAIICQQYSQLDSTSSMLNCPRPRPHNAFYCFAKETSRVKVRAITFFKFWKNFVFALPTSTVQYCINDLCGLWSFPRHFYFIFEKVCYRTTFTLKSVTYRNSKCIYFVKLTRSSVLNINLFSVGLRSASFVATFMQNTCFDGIFKSHRIPELQQTHSVVPRKIFSNFEKIVVCYNQKLSSTYLQNEIFLRYLIKRRENFCIFSS